MKTKLNTEDLDFTIDTSSEVLSLLNGKKLDSSTLTFCVVGIDRLMKSARGLRKLIVDSQNDPHLEFSAAIVLRSVLSDALIILNAYTRKQENVADFCYAALASAVHHLVENVRCLTDEEKKLAYNSIVKKYPEYFDKDQTNGKKPTVKFKSVRLSELKNEALFKNIKDSDIVNEYSGVYQSYLYYSKYDHFTEIYHDFEESGYEKQILKIVEVSRLLPRLLMYLLHILVRYQLCRKGMNSEAIEKAFKKTMKYNDAKFGSIEIPDIGNA